MAFPWAAIATVAAFGKAYATYQQGMATKAYYDAKAAASGVMPMEGSAATAQIASLKVGSEEFAISMINQELMQNLGLIEFGNLKNAGKQAKKAGIMGAIFGLGTDIGTIGQAGSFETKPDVIDTSKDIPMGQGEPF